MRTGNRKSLSAATLIKGRTSIGGFNDGYGLGPWILPLFKHRRRKLWVGFRDLRGDPFAQQPQGFHRRWGGGGDDIGDVKREPRLGDDLVERVARMQALEPKPATLAIEREQTPAGNQGYRAARTIDSRRARSRRANEIHSLDQGSRRMFVPEQNHARDDERQMGRPERSGEPRLRVLIIADANQVDIRLPVDLRAGEEEDVETSLAGAVEQFAAAIGEGRLAL